MSTYKEAIDAINSFLVDINKLSPFSEILFQGIFIKKLSNSNLISSKKYLDITTRRRSHQSHLDLTGQDTLAFFFGDNPNSKKEYSQIMLDIPSDHLRLLQELNNSVEIEATRGTPKKRVLLQKRNVPNTFNFTRSSDLYFYAYAFKKLEGHSGEQSQINRLQNKDAFFDLCSCAFEGDFLIFMKHSLNHYVCILMPSEYSSTLAKLIGSSVNFSVNNPSFCVEESSEAFSEIMKKNAMQEFDDISSFTMSLSAEMNGYDKEQLTKVRVGQSSFRKLLIEQRGCTCELCNINVPEALRASHIQSWSTSTPSERLDTQNGLLLCANHDALFDRHLITLDVNTNDLLISSSISSDQHDELNLTHTKRINMTDRMKIYMQKHNHLFES